MVVSLSQAQQSKRNGSKVAHLVTQSGKAYTLVNTPESLALAKQAPVFTEVARPGRQPLLLQDSVPLPTISFTHTIAAVTGVNVLAAVTQLQSLAGSGNQVRLIGVQPMARGWFQITDLSTKIVELTANQDPKVVELSWVLTRAQTLQVTIGRSLPALTMRDLEQIAITRGGSSVRKHTVTAGETLRSIAEQDLGDPDRWTDIADLNRETLVEAAKQNKFLNDNTPTQPAGPQFGGYDPDADTVPRRALTSLPPGTVLILPAVNLATAGVAGTGTAGGGGGSRPRFE